MFLHLTCVICVRLEKFVNLNFTGFHKILKKHDRRLPNPCRAFYTARLHDQSWVRGDYSDVIVSMSRVYSKLRGDEEKEGNDNERQDFVRSTRKYWVHTEDISEIKYTVLQHLPVFLQKTMAGETDSQLVNSVYLDNYSMELYHGRLEKSPGAIALRFRWYGTGTPDVVFVERKTHRDSWAGEVSVKERFTIREDQVPSLLQGTFDLEGEIQRLRKKGKSEEDIRDWKELASEVIQAINSKQLVPTMRTQYMRTAFQIPFDATVRISLDTNLCMIYERTKETLNGIRWFRDPSKSVPLNEITRFPHGVLEVKLQLEDESKTPLWVTDMLQSGKLLEVHKFSKFIHGCSVLMPEDVRAFPYWIDDVTLSDSIYRSGASKILETSEGANQHYQHLLPHDQAGKVKSSHVASTLPRIQPPSEEVAHSVSQGIPQIADGGDWYRCDDCCDDWCEWAESAEAGHITIQKVGKIIQIMIIIATI
ncbi:VTC domain-containing protein [archaeon]|nr:MAG: VTC domain-containing protein [archaeon]